MASASDAEGALRSTNGKENFQRITRLLMCGGVRLLKETFDSFHSPADLPLKLADRAIQSQLKSAKISKAEWDCLYPSTGTFGKSADFDITLTFRLLRTICNLKPPVKGWDSLPSCADHSLEADLARIKYYRNSIYGHNQTMEILESKFGNLWKEISEALLRIAGNISPAKKNEWKKSIDKLLDDPLTPEAQNCADELALWCKKDMDAKCAVEQLKEQLQEVNVDVKDKLQQVDVDVKDVKDQLQQVNKKLDSVLIIFGLDSFSQIGQPTTLVRSCSLSRRKSPLFTHQQQPQPVAAEGTSGEHPQENRRDPDPPEDPDIWKVIFSFKESFDLLFEYFGNQLEVGISSYGPGSLFIIVTCSSLEILERLWEDYRSGHLNEVAEGILITKQVLEKLSLSEVKLKTIIKEEDYKNCKESFVGTDQNRDIMVGSQEGVYLHVPELQVGAELAWSEEHMEDYMAEAAHSGNVVEIEDDSHFQSEMTKAGAKLVVVDFTASWCFPSIIIAPTFSYLSTKYSAAVFLKVDVDKCKDITARHGVSSMPTFQFFKGTQQKTKVDQVIGADKELLEEKIQNWIEDSGVLGHMNLRNFVSMRGCECLNGRDDCHLSSVLTKGPKFLESDCDEQLLVTIAFTRAVKLHSLKIQGPRDGKGPKTVKLFTNLTKTMDFDSAESSEALQTLQLKPRNIKEDAIIPLKFVKFQNVSSLTLFFQDNQGGKETTVVEYMGFIGSPVAAQTKQVYERIRSDSSDSSDSDISFLFGL